MYIMENLESYKKEYAILQEKYNNLIEENKELKKTIILLKNNKEVLDSVDSLFESLDKKSLDNVYEAIKKRHTLGIILDI